MPCEELSEEDQLRAQSRFREDESRAARVEFESLLAAKKRPVARANDARVERLLWLARRAG